MDLKWLVKKEYITLIKSVQDDNTYDIMKLSVIIGKDDIVRFILRNVKLGMTEDESLFPLQKYNMLIVTSIINGRTNIFHILYEIISNMKYRRYTLSMGKYDYQYFIAAVNNHRYDIMRFFYDKLVIKDNLVGNSEKALTSNNIVFLDDLIRFGLNPKLIPYKYYLIATDYGFVNIINHIDSIIWKYEGEVNDDVRKLLEVSRKGDVELIKAYPPEKYRHINLINAVKYGNFELAEYLKSKISVFDKVDVYNIEFRPLNREDLYIADTFVDMSRYNPNEEYLDEYRNYVNDINKILSEVYDKHISKELVGYILY